MSATRFKSWAVLGTSPAPWKCEGWFVKDCNGMNAATINGILHRKMCANACAIEALPDLYDALVYLTNASMDLVVDCPALDKARAMAIAAIRKAAGESGNESEVTK